MTKDYFGRREPAIKTSINNEDFLAIKELTLKTCTSKFNLDLKNNRSYTLFAEGEQSQSDIDLNRKSGNETRIEEKQESYLGEEEEVYERLAELEEINELKNKIPKFTDIHDKDITIVYRNFVELLLIAAEFKFNNPRLDKGLEKLFDEFIIPRASKQL